MKKLKYIKILLFMGLLLNFSCGKDAINLDLTKDPNYLSEDQVDPDYLLNAVQVRFGYMVEKYGLIGARLTRISHMSGRFYENVYTPAQLDDEWRDAYADIFKDLNMMSTIAEEKSLNHHVAMGKVISAYTLMTLVDFFGDVPYSEAINEDIIYPKPDSGADVYAAAIQMLDEAIALFEGDAGAEPKVDLFYDNDKIDVSQDALEAWKAKWIKVANTLKMKAYMTTRLVDPDAMTKFNDIVTSGNYISDNSEDFQFAWGTNEINPDSRHPRYRDSYTSSGGQIYQSNSFMDYMTGLTDDAYLAPDHFDPRSLFYFYRQVSATPGQAGEPADEQLLECSVFPPPPHYAGYTYCGVPKGWWGRDHGNDRGIPPDGFKRTLYGVYPAGGALDDLSYQDKKNGDGYGGAGITPIMLASWVKFMIAEYDMVNSDVANAKIHMFEGIDMSMDKVFNFKPTTPRFDYIFSGDPNLLPTIDEYATWFKADLENDWDGAASTDEQWNILARQYFVAMFGNGIDAYNFYRRTGFPHDLQPNLEPDPGPFIRSMYYPANTVNNNPNISQKSTVAQQVYWDTNPPSPGFPVSN